jgi:hypothetical protein
MANSRMAYNLSNFYGIDRILFGDSNPKDLLKEGEFSNYQTAKGAFLSNAYDIYTKLGFDPQRGFKSPKKLVEYGIIRADKSLERAKKIVSTSSVTKMLKEEYRQMTGGKKTSRARKVANSLVLENIQKVAIDSMIMESAIKNGCPVCIQKWETKILFDAHKTLRDALIKYAA